MVVEGKSLICGTQTEVLDARWCKALSLYGTVQTGSGRDVDTDAADNGRSLFQLNAEVVEVLVAVVACREAQPNGPI